MERAGDIIKGIADDHGLKAARPKALTPIRRRMAETAKNIERRAAALKDACYLHSVLCQVSLPRSATPKREFEAVNGSASMLVTAGKLRDSRTKVWVSQPLPYGAKPRVILINMTTYAIREKTRIVNVGKSIREFMMRMQIDPQGSEYKSLRTQLAALAACRMQLAFDGVSSMDAQPIKANYEDAWLTPNEWQQALWPGEIEFTEEYFSNVTEHAVPLDERAVLALHDSALCLDIYTWLAERLQRVGKHKVFLSWDRLKSQFGQDYGRLNGFVTEFEKALSRVLDVYPDAKVSGVESAEGGLSLHECLPPIPKRLVGGC